jgi:hypothetical protein
MAGSPEQACRTIPKPGRGAGRGTGRAPWATGMGPGRSRGRATSMHDRSSMGWHVCGDDGSADGADSCRRQPGWARSGARANGGCALLGLRRSWCGPRTLSRRWPMLSYDRGMDVACLYEQ